MPSVLRSLENPDWKGRTRIPWAERIVTEYVDWVELEHPQLKRRLDEIPFVMFQGSPRAIRETVDRWHACTVHDRTDRFGHLGLSLRAYPDGTVVPSNTDFPVGNMTPATAVEVGEENACWLDAEYVASWEASVRANARQEEEAALAATPKKALQYHVDHKGALYRDTELGRVYWNVHARQDFYYDDAGEAQWMGD